MSKSRSQSLGSFRTVIWEVRYTSHVRVNFGRNPRDEKKSAQPRQGTVLIASAARAALPLRPHWIADVEMAVRLRRQGLGKPLVVGFGGDLSLGGLIDQSLPQSLPDAAAKRALKAARRQHPLLQRGMRTTEVWGDCVGDLQADVMTISLTSPLTMHDQRSRAAGGGLKAGAKRAHPMQVEALLDANIDFVSLANGHSMDFREEGLVDTWEALDAARIMHAGSGVDRTSALRPALLRANGRRVACFSISAAGCGLRDAAGVEMWAAGEERAGIYHFELWDTRMHDEALREIRDAASARHASPNASPSTACHLRALSPSAQRVLVPTCHSPRCRARSRRRPNCT